MPKLINKGELIPMSKLKCPVCESVFDIDLDERPILYNSDMVQCTKCGVMKPVERFKLIEENEENDVRTEEIILGDGKVLVGRFVVPTRAGSGIRLTQTTMKWRIGDVVEDFSPNDEHYIVATVDIWIRNLESAEVLKKVVDQVVQRFKDDEPKLAG